MRRPLHFLYTAEGKEYLEREYIQNEKSMSDIAREFDLCANTVMRAMERHGIKRRGHSESFQLLMKQGKVKSTKGTKMSQEHRDAVSRGLARYWSELSKEEYDEKVAMCAKRWAEIPEEQMKEMRSLAASRAREALRDGSQMEKFLVEGLSTFGHSPKMHAKIPTADNSQMHVDILLAMERIAIEVDGPTHFLPVYGEERLAKTLRSDMKKNELLMDMGYTIIRLKCNSRTISAWRKKTILREIRDVVQRVLSQKGRKPELVELWSNDADVVSIDMEKLEELANRKE